MRIDPSIDSRLDPRFKALSREAAIAAEQMATGATLLGKAHSVLSGLYAQAFFNLSIGMERAGKLAFVLDHCFENSGLFPNNDKLTAFRHNVRKVIEKADEISQRRRSGDEYERLPRSDITEGIIDTLTAFAEETRYYNLDLLVQGKSQAKTDPMKMWYERVGKPILDKHYKPKRKAKHRAEAAIVAALMDQTTFVMQTTETGAPIDSLSQGFLHSNETAVIGKYSRMYAMQINRFLATLLSDMGNEAYKYRYDFIPHMSDFFGIFRNHDSYFLKRKTWSIYQP